ncbi:hypothetical protein PLESTF_000336200 [Pleodorina starrii]|nr:hypothetical protein PLESTF_000336200 [Pleodorina starrii]
MKVTLCWRPDPNTACEIQAVEEFRSKIVAYTGTWPAFWNAHAANVLDTCEGAAALVSVLGASQAGSTLTVLGSWGPDAAALYMGRVMPSPWGRMAVTNPNTKPSADASAAQTGAHGPKALTWKSGSPISLPYEWHQLLGQTRFAETLSLHAVLEPLLLGGRLVGALLVVTYGGRMPHSKATREALPCNGSGLAAAPFTSPVTWTGGAGAGAGGGGGERGAGESSPESAFASVASSILHRLKKRAGSGRSSPSSAPSPGLLRGLGAALSQAAFAPHLQAVVRLCSACQSLATATTLAGLSSIISATVSEALAAELHVSLAVRVAVVPPMHGQYGYLLPAWGESGLGLGSAFFNGDSPVKRAASSILPNCAAAASSARALRPAGRGNSFSGQAPASASNAIVSSPGGFLAKADSAKVAPFPLPSSLLLQLLRGSSRAGYGSAHAGANGSASNVFAKVSYNPEEPTVRGFVSQLAVDAFGAAVKVPPPPPAVTSPMARESAASYGGGFPASSGGSNSFVSGMVVSNLAAWMQDVERPSSDVALLIMAARGRASAAAAASAAGMAGRPSQGGAGVGGAMGGGPACLVAVAGCAPQRTGGALAAAAAAAIAASGSLHNAPSVKAGNMADDPWVRSFDTSQRRGVAGGGGGAAEMSPHRGNGYGGGGVRYEGGASSGPCVALYISTQGRLPTSLLRAVKDRAAALLEVLLPACLSSLSMGPVRAEVDRLPAPGGGGNNTVFSTRRILAATSSIPGGGGGGGTSVATPSASASATPLPSTHISGSHVQLSQLQLQMQQAAARASRDRDNPSPRKGAGAAEAGAAAPAPALPSPLRDGGGAAAGLASNPGGVAAAAAAAGGTAQRGGKGPRDGSDGEGGGHLIPVVMGSSRDICLITQQRWPEGGSATQMGTGSGVGLGTSPCCAPPAASSLVPTAPSSQSRTTRGSPGSYVFGVSGCGEDGALGLGTGTGLLASMDVTGAMDDMVTSMRHNLDVWVASFWEMLRDNTAHAKGGHTPGSYADDDLRFLRIYQQLGSGGAASVYAGVLLGMDVAVKVIEPPPEVDMEALAGSQAPPREAEEEGGPAGDAEEAEGEGERMASLAAAVRQAQMRELVRSARECAVLTTLSHPAIVQVYSFHTRVQVVPGEGPDRLPRLVPVPPGEGGEAQGPLHSVLIMERCDLGSLADALDNGMFKKAIIAAAQAAPAPASNSARPAAAGARPSNGQVSGGGGGNGGFSFSSVGSVSGGGIGGGAAMRAIYLTLLEVALALRHLHSMNLVHCDVKVANVLLKSSASDPRGFTCKLSDFGLINLLRDHEGEEGEGEERKGQEGAEATDEAEAGRESDPQAVRGAAEAVTTSPSTHRKLWMRNADAAGTVTHLAPECFQPGSKLDQSVDIYAFGIVMWEVFTRKPPYAEFAPEFEGLAARVLAGLRPRFPSHCPPAYRALAQACWCRDAARRPTAASVVNCLQQMLEGPL